MARRRFAIGATLLSVITAIGLGWYFISRDAAGTDATSAALSSTRIRSIAVLPFSGERADEIATSMETALATQFTLLPGAAVALGAKVNPQEVLVSRNADAVVTGESHIVGRYLAIRLFIHTNGQMRHAWTEIIPAAASAKYLESRLRFAADAMGLQRDSLGKLPIQSTEAEQRALAGFLHLDKARTEKNSLRALAEFNSALRAAPDLAIAHAGLCEALITESIRTGNVRRLDEASSSCARAVALRPQLVESVRAQANLDRKQGRIESALSGSASALELNGNDVDAMLVAAEAHLAKNLKDNSADDRDQAIAILNRAREVEPRFWKPAAILARVFFSEGNVAEAIKTQIIASELDRNSQTLSNLGSFHFCAGHFVEARAAFVAAKAAQPEEYIGDAQIAVADYQLRQFNKAAEGFARAARQHEANGDPEVFQLWGNLGDALRLSGKYSESKAAYEKAIALVEQAVTRDSSSRARAYRVSYYTSMNLMDKTYLNDTLRKSLLKELTDLEATTTPDVLLEVAIGHHRLGNRDKALQLRERLTPSCPGYNVNPEFDAAKTAHR